ncbi:hypothetical protein Tco_1310904 [Tanacetum coccineum]
MEFYNMIPLRISSSSNSSRTVTPFKTVFIKLISDLRVVESMRIGINNTLRCFPDGYFDEKEDDLHVTNVDFIMEWLSRVYESLKSLSITDFWSASKHYFLLPVILKVHHKIGSVPNNVDALSNLLESEKRIDAENNVRPVAYNKCTNGILEYNPTPETLFDMNQRKLQPLTQRILMLWSEEKGKRVTETSLKFFDFNASSLQERRALEPGTSMTIFKYPALKQLAIKRGDEYGFVIRPCLVGVTFKSVRIDL